MQHASWDAVPVSDQVGQAAEVAKLVRVSGSVTIIRANRSALDAKRGDLVHLGDMVQTAADGAAGIAFPDGTIFNLAASGRIAVSEFLYDPSGTSNAALVNVIQGTFAYIAGKVAATGNINIHTPIGTVRIGGSAPSSGIGILTLAALTLYGVRDMHAMGGDAVLDNDTIDPTDQDDKPHGKYGTYVLLSREDPSQVLGVVDNPDIVLVLRAKGSAAEYFTITPGQRAEFQSAYREAFRTFLAGQEDNLFNRAGPGGSSTPPGGLLAPLLFEQYGNGIPLLNINLNATDVPFITHDLIPPLPSPPPPTLTAQPVGGVEGTLIPLNVAASGNGGTVSSLVVGNIPVGATLSDAAGHTFTATAGNTSVDIIDWTLSSLTITPTTDTNFALSVTATATDSSGQTHLLSTTERVTVYPLAPTVSAGEVKGLEGSAIPLKITASANGDSSLSSLLIGDIPEGATLSDGTGNTFTASPGHTSVDIIGWNLSSLTLTPTTDTNFTLSVTATSTDGDGQTNTASTTELVTVDPLAPTVTAVSVEGIEGTPIPLKITASANGDSSLSSLLIDNIPVGATLSDGTGNIFTASPGHTSVDIIGWKLSSLTITSTTDTNFTLSVTATSTDSGGQSHSATNTEPVTVDPLAPTVTAVSVEGVEGSPIPLKITASANGDSTLSSLLISDIPEGATLSDGAGHSFTASTGNTSVDIIGWNLSSLTITPTTDTSFTLNVTATSKDSEGQTNTASTTESVTVEVPDDHWKITSNGNWSSDPHWTLASPTSTMTAVIDANAINGTSSSYTVTISQPAVASALIVNDAQATVRDDASLTLSGTFTVNAGTFELNNGGLLAASIFIGTNGTFLVSHGDYTISEPIADYGMIEVARDTLQIAGTLSGTGAFKVDSGATLQFSGSDTIAGTLTDNGKVEVVSGTLEVAGSISGTGVFQIDAGATLQLDGSDSNNVVFSGATGELVLEDPSTFSGKIIGLSGSDTIDLTNISFGADTRVSNVTYSKATNITTLTVTDGTNVDKIQLVGNYTGSTWTLSDDGGNFGEALGDSWAGVISNSIKQFDNAHSFALDTLLAHHQDQLAQLQQSLQDVTGQHNPLVNNGQLQDTIRDLTGGHNPLVNETGGEDLHFGIWHHDFIIHT